MSRVLRILKYMCSFKHMPLQLSRIQIHGLEDNRKQEWNLDSKVLDHICVDLDLNKKISWIDLPLSHGRKNQGLGHRAPPLHGSFGSTVDDGRVHGRFGSNKMTGPHLGDLPAPRYFLLGTTTSWVGLGSKLIQIRSNWHVIGHIHPTRERQA